MTVSSYSQAAGAAVAERPARHRKHELAQALRAGRRIRRFMYYTYVLRSEKDQQLYVGWTDDLKRRYNQHCEGRVTSTKHRRPLRLVYYEACLDKEKAIQREKYFKTGFGRRYLQGRI